MEGVPSMQGLAAVLKIVARFSRMQGEGESDPVAEGFSIQETLYALGESADGDIEHTVQAYKHAAFIYLYRVWCNVGAPNPLTLKHAASCLYHLSQVKLSSPLLSGHVWPLWTAGCETIDGQLRQFVCDRVDAMYAVRHLPSLQRIRQDIEEVWKCKDYSRNSTGVDNVDCIKVILRNRQREADLA
ncbi:hypothetical protein DL766_002665 [Monosporascus sp. MC13-8B]|uniref:Uncharacterized protein n=1 Tax=Monosporascus cannonballus TaxID=155416 RepID=A0ABY0H3L3_9PEZI|nr:hypothetical protein DL762_007481 [Monosporascus cannonballus]RYO83814.1 hypothetical protein DL763_007693 [Monosporascus cannonballus]RYP35101.1 hypothetical protein DL766_002665 [Monosporascus sp. MC13-8B]